MEMLNEPLLTEDGFINEACIKELNSVIQNMPKTHERLLGDPEWNTPRWTSWRDIVASLAYWSIHQIYSDRLLVHPPGLENILGFLSHCIRPKFDKYGYAELSLCDINKMLYDILYEQGISIFDGWNSDEVMGDAWLDLDALLHNVCLQIRSNRREFDAFNKKIGLELEEIGEVTEN